MWSSASLSVCYLNPVSHNIFSHIFAMIITLLIITLHIFIMYHPCVTSIPTCQSKVHRPQFISSFNLYRVCRRVQFSNETLASTILKRNSPELPFPTAPIWNTYHPILKYFTQIRIYQKLPMLMNVFLIPLVVQSEILLANLETLKTQITQRLSL